MTLSGWAIGLECANWRSIRKFMTKFLIYERKKVCKRFLGKLNESRAWLCLESRLSVNISAAFKSFHKSKRPKHRESSSSWIASFSNKTACVYNKTRRRIHLNSSPDDANRFRIFFPIIKSYIWIRNSLRIANAPREVMRAAKNFFSSFSLEIYVNGEKFTQWKHRQIGVVGVGEKPIWRWKCEVAVAVSNESSDDDNVN